MTLKEALELTRLSKIAEETSLCFKAMVMFWIGANYRYDVVKTAKTTKYSEQEVELVFNNWAKSNILVDGKIHGEFDGLETDWMEIILISMCGAGELVRIEDKYGTEQIKPDSKMSNRKTLNEHLFDQLDRLSEAQDEAALDLERNRAASLIDVAEKVLDVARLKLSIIAAGSTVDEGFKEIDAPAEPSGDKKKLTP